MHFVIIGGDGVQLLGGIYTPHPPPVSAPLYASKNIEPNNPSRTTHDN